jgi:hypothetical protein
MMSGSRLLILASLLVAFAGASDAQSTPVSFELDVQPLLTATGCNTGACHGKQRGQNGFQLSLLGFDSDFDFDSLVRQARGRRVFPGAPESSLLLRKATAQDPHGGGKRFDVDSPAYRLLLAWIQQGAPRRVEGEPTLDHVELTEVAFSLAPTQTADLSVIAYYSDGTTRDVTGRTTYLSNDAAIVAVDEAGQMTAGSLPGETAIMARYMNHICVANVVIPRQGSVPAEYYADLPRANFIDDLVIAKLQKLAIKPADPAPDHVFLRRVYTDVIGRLPSVDEAEQFLSSDVQDKRERLIDSLLQRREYVDHWANQWADLLRPNPYRVGIKAVFNYDNWIREQFRQNVSYDRFVRALVTAKGSTWQNGAATLYRDRRSPDEVATLTSQLFLGVRLECAKCHHHPFEKWSQEDFYSFAAYFARVGHKGTGLSPPISGSEEVVYVATRGEVKHPISGETLTPRPLFGEAPEVSEGDPRESLADWMTSSENEYFAKVQVNRVWAAMMGRGLVEPVDDLRSTNPPTNPELLDALAKEFQSSGYDLKHLIKTIASAHAYSLDSTPNDTNTADRLNYSRHYRHRMRAEVLLDAVADVTETPTKFSAMPAGSRANQVWTHRIDSTFLDTYGRPNENQDPPCERTTDATVTQLLHLMNSQEIDGRIRSDAARAARLAASDRTAGEIVDELYLAIFSRLPGEGEQQYARKLIDGAENRRVVIEDIMWALMNSPEFTIQN